MQCFVYVGVGLVDLDRTVKSVRHDGLVVKRRSESVDHVENGRKRSVDVNAQNIEKNVAFVLEIAVDDARGHACLLCDLRGVGVVVSDFGEQLVACLDDFVFLFDGTFLFWFSDFLRHNFPYTRARYIC